MMKIGLDFGGVIVPLGLTVAGEDTALADGAMKAPRPGAIDAIRRLVEITEGQVWIVSKAGEKMQERTLQWLLNQDFCRRTGLALDHVRFCLTREEKAPISVELGITHFLDDRVHLMQILRGTVAHLFLFQESGSSAGCPGWFQVVSSWDDFLLALDKRDSDQDSPETRSEVDG